MLRKIPVLLALFGILAGCLPAGQISTQEPVPNQTAALPTGAIPSQSPAAADTPTPSLPPAAIPIDQMPEEAILILEPGPGSRLVDSIHLAGRAGPTFESHLLVLVVLEDGSVLTSLPLIIQAEMGSRGPSALDIPFELAEERQAFILVSSSSPRDGGVTHLASVGVTLAVEGPAAIRPVESHAERITITRPALGETLSGGLARVEGIALPSFEGTLIVELLDGEGNPLASLPVIVQAPDMGQYGPFAIDLPFQVSAPGPGRLVVRDPSVVFQGDVHLASVEVELAP